MYNERQLNWASKVAEFMMSMHNIDQAKYDKATENGIPYGDLAYGQALEHWHSKGCPANAFFSYASTERPCPLLMAFRKEITERFKLPILTHEEAEQRKRLLNGVKEFKVNDWGLN